MSKQVSVAIMLLRQSIEQAFVFFRVFSKGKRDPPVPVRAQQGHPTIFCNLTNLFAAAISVLANCSYLRARKWLLSKFSLT